MNSEIKDIILDNKYVLWYHSVENKSWEKDSYINLCQDFPNNVISTANQLFSIYNSIKNNFTAGMFFLMKEGVFPSWEDASNINGGCWSCKVPKKKTNEMWNKMSAGLIGNTLTSDQKYIKSITGISISPKISNCVLKIWNNSSELNNCEIFTKEIDYLNQSCIRYNKNKS